VVEYQARLLAEDGSYTECVPIQIGFESGRLRPKAFAEFENVSKGNYKAILIYDQGGLVVNAAGVSTKVIEDGATVLINITDARW
jgi:hypothetical protein